MEKSIDELLKLASLQKNDINKAIKPQDIQALMDEAIKLDKELGMIFTEGTDTNETIPEVILKNYLKDISELQSVIGEIRSNIAEDFFGGSDWALTDPEIAGELLREWMMKNKDYPFESDKINTLIKKKSLSQNAWFQWGGYIPGLSYFSGKKPVLPDMSEVVYTLTNQDLLALHTELSTLSYDVFINGKDFGINTIRGSSGKWYKGNRRSWSHPQIAEYNLLYFVQPKHTLKSNKQEVYSSSRVINSNYLKGGQKESDKDKEVNKSFAELFHVNEEGEAIIKTRIGEYREKDKTLYQEAGAKAETFFRNESKGRSIEDFVLKNFREAREAYLIEVSNQLDTSDRCKRLLDQITKQKLLLIQLVKLGYSNEKESLKILSLLPEKTSIKDLYTNAIKNVRVAKSDKEALSYENVAKVKEFEVGIGHFDYPLGFDQKQMKDLIKVEEILHSKQWPSIHKKLNDWLKTKGTRKVVNIEFPEKVSGDHSMMTEAV